MLSISASPAPPKVAQQIYTQATLTKMCLRFHQGEAMEKTLAWAEGECRRLHAELGRKDIAATACAYAQAAAATSVFTSGKREPSQPALDHLQIGFIDR